MNKALSHILRKCLPFGEASRGASPRGATPIERVPARSLQRHHLTLGVLLGGSVLLSVGFLQSSDTTGHIVANGNNLSAETSLQDIVVTATRIPDARYLLPPWHEETVRSGDNLSLIFARAGFSERDVYQVSSADGGRALRKIFPGETIAFLKDESSELVKVKHVQSRLKWTTFSRRGSQYSAQTVERSPEIRERSATMRIA